MSGGSLIVRTPAKVTLSLRVLGRRDDGYHRVEILMQAVDLFDQLLVSPSRGLEVICSHPEVPDGEENTVHRALEALGMRRPGGPGLRVEIQKRIPVAAGLGGGSSNAAGALLAAERIWGIEGEPEHRLEAARAAGMDTPFFLTGGTALCTGRGDLVQPLPALPRLHLVLVSPALQVSTRSIYERVPTPLTTVEAVDSLRCLGRWKGAEDVLGHLANDLEPITMAEAPVVRALKERLLSLGALGASMSGSGPAVFGIFTDPLRSLAARRALVGEGFRAIPARCWAGGCVVEG